MKKRVITVLLALAMVVSLLPGMAFAAEIVNSDSREEYALINEVLMNTTTCYDYTIKLVSDTYRYLDEIYIEQYPELGLRFCYGGPKDEIVLKDLVIAITDGCFTNKEKADAINAWVKRNISYGDTCPLPIETFYTRSGVCLNYAMLLSTLFRLAGIPSTWGDGWRGNMELLTPNDVTSTAVGHAWCFAYVDGEWILYDPLWLDNGTTDREYIAKNYYFQMVEGITPVYDNDEFSPQWISNPNWYKDGKFFANTNYIINWSVRLMMQEYLPYDGYSYVDTSKDESLMVEGEAYRDGWLIGGSKQYLYENGIMAAGVVRSEDGKQYYFDAQSGHAFEILCDPALYNIVYGFFSVAPGYTGIPLAPTSPHNEKIIRWESDSGAVTVDENGVLTAVKPGQAAIAAHFYDTDGTYYGCGCWYTLYVYDGDRSLDYRDNYLDHEHQYTAILRESPIDHEQYILYTCTIGDCADSHIGPGSVPVLVHAYTSKTIMPSCTENGYILYECTCGHQYTEVHGEPAGHTWGNWEADEKTGRTIRKCNNCDTQEIQGLIAEGICGDNMIWEISDQGVLSILGKGEMYDCYWLDSPWSFYGDTITQVVIGEGVESIGEYAFAHLANLKHIQIADTVTCIEAQAFWDCNSLISIEIPGSVTSLGNGAFDACYGLEQVYFEGNAPIFGDAVFCMVEATIYCHKGASWPLNVMQNHGGNLTWDVYGEHTHEYAIVEVEPTCIQQGFVIYTCTICGSGNVNYQAATSHSFTEGLCTACGAHDPNFKPAGLLGDADGSGEVDYVDAMIVLQYHTGVVGDDALDLNCCDVDGSGEVDYVDAMMILQYHTGVISGF